MALIEINTDPSRRDLRIFSLLLIVFCSVVGWTVYRRTGSETTGYLVAGIGGLIGLVGSVAPMLARPVYVGWMYAVSPIGFVVSNVIVAVTFFGVVWPIALIMGIRKRDPLLLRFNKDAKTYWVPRPAMTDPRRYFRQY
jgi:hypothetical protein